MRLVEIPVSEEFLPFVEAALMRVGYLLPGVPLEYEKNRSLISVHVDDDQDPQRLAKEVRYALYRERIFKETLPIRKRILGA